MDKMYFGSIYELTIEQLKECSVENIKGIIDPHDYLYESSEFVELLKYEIIQLNKLISNNHEYYQALLKEKFEVINSSKIKTKKEYGSVDYYNSEEDECSYDYKLELIDEETNRYVENIEKLNIAISILS